MPLPHRRQFLKTTLGGAAALSLASELSLVRAFRPEAPFRVGLIGCGRQGRALLSELAKFENLSVVALCDTAESRLSAGLRRVKGALGYATQRELLQQHQDLQAYFVATPTHDHKPIVLELLAAGKHVYCEAPLAHNEADALELCKAARSAAGSVFQVGHLGRVNPIYLLANKFMRSGSIGDPVSMRGQSHAKNSWRVPAQDGSAERALNWKLDAELSLGLIGELGSHAFDVFHWFSGAYPSAVSAQGSLRLHKDGRSLPDTVHCQFSFEDGRCLFYEATLANSYEGDYELLHGTLGAIKLASNAGWMFKEPDAPTQGWEVYANRESFHNEQGITLIAEATKLAAQDKLKEGIGLEHPPLYYGVEAFLKSCLVQEPVACDVHEGARCLAVSLAAKKALETGVKTPIGGAAFEQ